MKITIESTTKTVELVAPSGTGMIEARVWQGQTDRGVPVQVYIALIAPEIPESDPNIDALTEQFDRDLKRRAAPRATVAAIPLRMIL